MGLGPDAFNVGAWDVEKSKGRKKKDEENEMTGCWFKFRFIGSCMSSKSKVDGSMSGTSTQYGILLFYFYTNVLCLLRFLNMINLVIWFYVVVDFD